MDLNYILYDYFGFKAPHLKNCPILKTYQIIFNYIDKNNNNISETFNIENKDNNFVKDTKKEIIIKGATNINIYKEEYQCCENAYTGINGECLCKLRYGQSCNKLS
jgi:hypothetical protein